MENFHDDDDDEMDNLEETKNLMQSFEKRYNENSENNFAQSHSEYIKRKLNFT